MRTHAVLTDDATFRGATRFILKLAAAVYFVVFVPWIYLSDSPTGFYLMFPFIIGAATFWGYWARWKIRRRERREKEERERQSSDLVCE